MSCVSGGVQEEAVVIRAAVQAQVPQEVHSGMREVFIPLPGLQPHPFLIECFHGKNIMHKINSCRSCKLFEIYLVITNWKVNSQVSLSR